ncbi:hypothetical protein M2272_005143 [Mycobacterium frederiksbergense]|uniref:DUF2510 domain-containing protein n=1 Tax=Mycolicibacterium frederiksbergense TaxID=117567 RepID=A0ABT6L6D5_9MYCO|nr:DUF2510 domain-containing protein [Mycolicibacterium frederiksbergense]MDH6198484.1 hypothetical protein [Mycolicibacterium frederiksbergense]
MSDVQKPSNPGWYPDPDAPGVERYWDGKHWIAYSDDEDDGAPGQPLDRNRQAAVAVGVCALSGIGVIMSMQSASLLTGTTTIWLGVGLAAAGLAAAYFLGATKAIRIVAIVALAIAVFSAGYMEKQLNDKRNEISQMFNP